MQAEEPLLLMNMEPHTEVAAEVVIFPMEATAVDLEAVTEVSQVEIEEAAENLTEVAVEEMVVVHMEMIVTEVATHLVVAAVGTIHQEMEAKKDYVADRGSSYGGGAPAGGPRVDDRVELKETVFVQGIPLNVNESYIADVFATVGEIAKHDKTGAPMIKIYTDGGTGEPKGESMITFISADISLRCIEMYNGQPFPGSEKAMIISIAKFKPQDNNMRGGGRGGGFGGGRGGGRGGFGGGRGGGGNSNFESRQNDWNWAECGNNNFAFRQACNQCSSPRSGGDGGSERGPMRAGDRGRGRRSNFGDDKNRS